MFCCFIPDMAYELRISDWSSDVVSSDLTVLIGKAEMFGADGIAPIGDEVATAIAGLREQGRTTMVVRMGDRDLGAIGLMDTPREAARTAIAKLRELGIGRSAEHTSELQSIMRISYAVFCLKKKNN